MQVYRVVQRRPDAAVPAPIGNGDHRDATIAADGPVERMIVSTGSARMATTAVATDKRTALEADPHDLTGNAQIDPSDRYRKPICIGLTMIRRPSLSSRTTSWTWMGARNVRRKEPSRREDVSVHAAISSAPIHRAEHESAGTIGDGRTARSVPRQRIPNVVRRADPAAMRAVAAIVADATRVQPPDHRPRDVPADPRHHP